MFDDGCDMSSALIISNMHLVLGSAIHGRPGLEQGQEGVGVGNVK